MFFDKPETQQRLSDTGALGEPSTFAERTIAAFKSTQDRNFGVVNGGAMLDAYEARRKAVMDAVGEDIGNPFTQAMNQLPPMGDANGYGMPGPLPELKPRGQMEADFQSALERLAEKHPDKRDIIAPHKPVRSTFASEVRDREQKSIDAGRNYGGITGTGPIADFAGGMGAQVTDPVNAATILIGPTGRVGQGAKAIIGMGVKQGIANAGVEAAMAPLVQDFRRQMGQSYGLGEAAYDIGTAAALGFAADAGIRTAARGIQSKLGRRAILDADGKVTGYESAEASIARATRQAESQARAEQLKALQDDGTLQRAMDGDPEAIAKVDPILGLSEDPAFRGARQVQEFVELEPGDFDDIAKSRAFTQTLRAAIDADEPPPVIKMERASNRPSLSDDMEIPKGTEGNQHFRTIDIEGKPVHFQNLDPKKITTDAESMQFKSGGNQFGVTGALGINTTFDPAAAGKVIVFERADGVTIIVDGHQRLSIAKDGDQFQGFVFREKDGWSAADVRAEAAMKNIQEGRANLLDTVRAMREHGPQMEGRIAVDTDFMRQAVGMSRLSDAAFVRLEAGTIEPHMAALVGELVPDQTKHDGVVQALMRANPATEAAARKIIGREIREPVSADELSQVMGASVAEPHVIEARTDVLAGVIGTLRGEPGYIGDVETQAVAKVISRLADRAGLVADTLNQAGRAVAEGQPLERAIDATLRRFEQVIAEAGVKGLAGQPIKLAPEKTATGIKISDFANKVNALKEKYGIGAEPTRSINAEDAVVLPDGQPRFLASLAPVEKSVGDLKAQLQEIKNGSRIVVVKKFADEFVASAKEIVAATEELKAIDVLDATHAELTQLEAATADLQKIVDRKLQDGYNSTEQVETARDYLSKAFEDLQAKYLDEVWMRASHLESKVADFNQDIMSRLESRLSEEKIDAIKDDVFTFESELLPAIRDPDTFPKDYSVLDIIKQDLDQVSSALKQMSDRLDEIVAKTDLDALDDVGLVRVLDETGDIENAIERFQERSDKMEDLSSDHAMGIYDAVEKINDDQVRPAVDDLEYAQSDIADIVGDIADRRAELAEETPTRLASLSDVDTGRSMRADLDALGYYSKALEAAKALKQAKGTPEQMLAALKKAGVKNAEIEATNLKQFLDGKTTITRDEIISHLTENRVGMKESLRVGSLEDWNERVSLPLAGRVGISALEMLPTGLRLGSTATRAYQAIDGMERVVTPPRYSQADGAGPTKWSTHSLDPSNPTYRETVLHLPVNTIDRDAFMAEHKLFHPNATQAERDAAFNKFARGETTSGLKDVAFASGHFSEPNIVGHMMTSLNKHEGKPVFTLDQIQSDWGQKLRDGGVRDEAKIAELKANSEAADAAFVAAEKVARDAVKKLDGGGFFSRAPSSTEIASLQDAASTAGAEARRIRGEYLTANSSPTGHPLVNTTDQWTTTTLRRALRQAAEADAEFIAIPSGDTVLSYNPGDAAGMKGFYGALPNREAASQTYQNGVEGIVPKNLRKLLEKLDKESAKPALIDKLETPAGMKGSGFTLFPLTDKVKKTVMEEGQPLFAKQDAPQAVDQKALQDFSDNLESVLREAQQPSPPRLVSDAKDAKAHTEELRETMAQEIKEAVDPATAEAVRHSTIRAFHGTGNSFDTFRIPRDAFGLHFGTSEQASKRLSDLNEKYREEGTHNPGGFLDGARIIPVDLDFKRSLTLPDLGAWSARTVAKAVSAADVKLAGLFDEVVAMQKRASSERRSKIAVDRDALDLIRTKLIAAGYDSVVYENTIEGAGLSYVALRNGTVRNWQTGDVMFSVIDPSEPLLYTPEANALQAEIRKEIDRTLQMLPPDVRIRVEDELVFNLNGGSDARIAGLWDGYDRLVYVALSGNDPVRAVRHEVIHALKQSGLLTADEFKQLYAFSETLKLRGAYKIDERYRDLYTKAYGERGGDYVENLLREETIAEMFADYSLNGRRFGDVAGGGLVDRLIDRIVSFMKLLRDNLGFIGFRNVNDIFQAIESGDVASRPSSRNPTGGRNPDVIARQIGEAVGGGRLASMQDQRPSDMINAAIDALPDETATAIRNVLNQANIDEAQIGSMVDSIMPLIRSGDQAAVAERVQAMAKEAAPQMMPPQSELGRALADVQADKEMLDVIGACRA